DGSATWLAGQGRVDVSGLYITLPPSHRRRDVPPTQRQEQRAMTSDPRGDFSPEQPVAEETPPTRRRLLQLLAGLGAGSAVFLPVTSLAALLRTRQVSSVELAKLYLQRLRKYDPVLRCVVSYTEELALKQAERADREIAAGRYRGPLHGVPWGAKDLIAQPGY